MLAKTEDLASAVSEWLARFERALGSGDDVALTALFLPHSHWRDVVAFTWHLTTNSGRDNVVAALKQYGPANRATGFQIDHRRTAPRNVTRVGTPAIEAIFKFETAQGRCSGVVRLVTAYTKRFTPIRNAASCFSGGSLCTSGSSQPSPRSD